jgi:hypothetical protein
MSRRVPEAWLWLRYPCRECGVRIANVRGHDVLPPTDPRSPKSLCFVCQAESARLQAGLAPSYEDNLGDDPERDRLAGLLIDQAFGEVR